MYSPPSTVPQGPIIWTSDDSEGTDLWQIEQLPVPRLVGAGERPYRLWCNGRPASGGQWHYTVEGAKWEAGRRNDFVIHNQLARALARVYDLERQLAETKKC